MPMNFLQEISIQCPYCAEQIGILVDCSVAFQEYIEDCQVCCRPIIFSVAVSEGQAPVVNVRREDD
jgi:hypothetical protein